MTLTLFCSEEIEIAAGIGKNVSRDAIAATQVAVEQAKANITSTPKLCLTIPESLTTSGVAILSGLKIALGKQIPIFGGTSADGFRLQRSYQFWNTEVTSDAVTILLFSGEVLFSHGIAHGWNPIGIITKADKNVLHEIDGKPAIDFYHHYLGDLPPSPEYPLAIFEIGDRDFYLRATPGTYIPNSGSITFVADIPENARVQIAEATRDDVLNAAKSSMLQALAAYPGKKPTAALFFICAARALEKENWILRKKLERIEVEQIQLEQNNQRKESLLRKVIDELQRSQTQIELKRAELESALRDRLAALRDRKRQQDSLRLIMEGTASHTGGEFFRCCVRYLAQVLNVRYAAIALTIP